MIVVLEFKDGTNDVIRNAKGVNDVDDGVQVLIEGNKAIGYKAKDIRSIDVVCR